MQAVIYKHDGLRARVVSSAIRDGINRFDDAYIAEKYEGPVGDIAVFYGLRDGHLNIMKEYLKAGKRTLFVDLGYWGRRVPSKYSGYHRLILDGLHPTKQLSETFDDSRVKKFNLRVKPWRKNGTKILLAGMSAKAAWVYGLGPEEWEREIVKKIKSREILYRPKPGWIGATRIGGTEFYNPNLPLKFDDVYMIVTHHSNTAIDGLIAGIPCYVEAGPALNLSSQLLEAQFPDGRQNFINALGYVQWTIDEIARGMPWKFLRDRWL